MKNDVLSPLREETCLPAGRDRERVEKKTETFTNYFTLIILLNLDFLRAAVFLWRIFFFVAVSITFITCGRSAAASCFFPSFIRSV